MPRGLFLENNKNAPDALNAVPGTGIDPCTNDYAKRSVRVRKQPIERRLKLNEEHIDDDNYTKYGRTLGVIED